MPFPRFHWTDMRIPCFSFHVSVMKLEKPRQEAPWSSFPFSCRLFGGCLGWRGRLTKTFSIYARESRLPFKLRQSSGMILDYTRRGHSRTLRSAFANLPSARFFSFQSLNPKLRTIQTKPLQQNYCMIIFDILLIYHYKNYSFADGTNMTYL